MRKHSSQWLTSLILSLSLHPSLSPSMPSLAWRSLLPSDLTHTPTKNKRLSLPHSQYSWQSSYSLTWLIYSHQLKNTHMISGSDYSTCWLTSHPQSHRQTGKELCVQHRTTCNLLTQSEWICVYGVVWGVFTKTHWSLSLPLCNNHSL